jgi:hypothetical protein
MDTEQFTQKNKNPVPRGPKKEAKKKLSPSWAQKEAKKYRNPTLVGPIEVTKKYKSIPRGPKKRQKI